MQPPRIYHQTRCLCLLLNVPVWENPQAIFLLERLTIQALGVQAVFKWLCGECRCAPGYQHHDLCLAGLSPSFLHHLYVGIYLRRVYTDLHTPKDFLTEAFPALMPTTPLLLGTAVDSSYSSLDHGSHL